MDVLGVLVVFAVLGVVIYFAKKAYDKHVAGGYGAVNTDVPPAEPNVADVVAGSAVPYNHEYETNKSV